ncbi:MAG: RNase adapter RapZ [Deltaproteobacteria bacterium]|nr:RNase adapter RapZ [Candidatus Anaeroferrophillacea bacterium]
MNGFSRDKTAVTIISGLAGAGKSTALRAFEDQGFFCIDNLPVALLPKFLELSATFAPEVKGIALVMDIREPGFPERFPPLLRELVETHDNLRLLFFEAADNALIKRFSETRRKHPLASGMPVSRGIERERLLLQPVRELASRIIDTSNLTVHQLRHQIRHLVAPAGEPGNMTITIISFGFRYGLPPEADMVMDVRFLPNPFFIPHLRPLSGLDEAVRTYVFDQEPTREFLARVTDLLRFLLPQYLREGKTYLTIGIGCTGGRHRSVSIAAGIKQELGRSGYQFQLVHRDLERNS